MGQVIAQARESGDIAMICGDRALPETATGLHFTRYIPLGEGRLVVGFRKGLTLAAPGDIASAAVARIAIPDQNAAVHGKPGSTAPSTPSW